MIKNILLILCVYLTASNCEFLKNKCISARDLNPGILSHQYLTKGYYINPDYKSGLDYETTRYKWLCRQIEGGFHFVIKVVVKVLENIIHMKIHVKE